MKPRAKLVDAWVIGGRLLCGKVYGHPNIEDGTEILCSRVAQHNQLGNVKATLVETRDTVYEVQGWRKGYRHYFEGEG